MSWRNVGILVAGLVAGAGAAYYTESSIPPALVMAVAFVAIIVADRYDV